MLTILAFTTLLVLVAASTAAARDPLPGKINRTILATWACQKQIPVPRTEKRRSPWKLAHHSEAFKRAELLRWQDRWRRCTYALQEKKRQWNWQAWLDDKWRRVGVCETGLNWAHSWYRRDGSGYVSAFGIQAGAFDGAYDHDAARIGMPPWSDDPRRRPTPWQQWKTALSHYAHHGGFSGWGCRGA